MDTIEEEEAPVDQLQLSVMGTLKDNCGIAN